MDMDIYINIIKIILILLGMVSGIYLLYRCLQSQRFQLRIKRDTKYAIKRHDTVHLGYKRFVSVIEVMGHIMVIGAGDKEMVLLAKWKKGEDE